MARNPTNGGGMPLSCLFEYSSRRNCCLDSSLPSFSMPVWSIWRLTCSGSGRFAVKLNRRWAAPRSCSCTLLRVSLATSLEETLLLLAYLLRVPLVPNWQQSLIVCFQVGASGAICGTLAAMWVDLFAHWNIEYKPFRKVNKVEQSLGSRLTRPTAYYPHHPTGYSNRYRVHPRC